jgi:hypothetical protein
MCSSNNIDKNIENIKDYYAKPVENINIIDFEQMLIDLISV